MVLSNYATIWQNFIFLPSPFERQRGKERYQNKNEINNALNLTPKKSHEDPALAKRLPRPCMWGTCSDLKAATLQNTHREAELSQHNLHIQLT